MSSVFLRFVICNVPTKLNINKQIEIYKEQLYIRTLFGNLNELVKIKFLNEFSIAVSRFTEFVNIQNTFIKTIFNIYIINRVYIYLQNFAQKKNI